MADPRNQPEQEEDHDGASAGEQLIEAARRNNTDLLQEVLSHYSSPEAAAELLNNTKSVLGNHIYHEAALRGNYEIIDILLDQENFECDPINRIEGDTPLHSAVRYINALPQPLSPSNLTAASELLSMMTEAGSDARIRNRANLTAAQLVDPSCASLRKQLEAAAEATEDHREYVVDDGDVIRDDEDEGDGGSASDSDFDMEEYKREKERRKREAASVRA